MLDSDLNAYKKKQWFDWFSLPEQLSSPAVLDASAYSPRRFLTASTLRDEQTEHTVTGTKPFKQSVVNEVERYLARHNTRAFLIWHKGELVHSHYINFQQNERFNATSMMMTLVGLCVGIAIDKGFLTHKDEPLGTYLDDWQEGARKHVTLDHVLMMQAGLNTRLSLPKVLPKIPLVSSWLNHHVEDPTNLKALSPPESHFVYDLQHTRLLVKVIESATNQNFSKFVEQHLWHPLGCADAFVWQPTAENEQWEQAFFARPLDWLKLASLFANHGKYGDLQLVPAEWIAVMKMPTNTLHRGVRHGHADFGRHLWVQAHHYGNVQGMNPLHTLHAFHKFNDNSMVMLEGLGGQYCFASEQHQLVVMRVGEKPARNWDASFVINTLVDGIQTTEKSGE